MSARCFRAAWPERVDCPKQAALAGAFVAKGAWVSMPALAEAMWVMDSVYDRSADQIALAVDMLLRHEQRVIERGDVVSAALDPFRAKPRADFSDCLRLEIARAAGHLPLGTFDRPSRREDCALLR